uniref:Uncharacterized protein n=1 Tax=Rhizophora mucronata TaxID=61149 RepID=A0A2P2IWS6_RHIMU
MWIEKKTMSNKAKMKPKSSTDQKKNSATLTCHSTLSIRR